MLRSIHWYRRSAAKTFKVMSDTQSRSGDTIPVPRSQNCLSGRELTDLLTNSKAHHIRPVMTRSVVEPSRRLRGRYGPVQGQAQSGERARAIGGGLVDIPNCSSNSLARPASVTISTALSRPPHSHFRTSKS